MQRFLLIGLLVYFLVFGVVLTTSAHSASIRAYEVLGIDEPTLLPDSPFYFFKNLTRGLARVFTFDPVKKAELELRFADEKLAEIDELVRKSDVEEDKLSEALANYLDAQSRLGARLEALKGKNKNVDDLFEKLAERTLRHSELFQNLQDELQEDDISKAQKALSKQAQKALELDQKKFKEKFEGQLEEEGLDLSDLEDIDIDVDDDQTDLDDKNEDENDSDDKDRNDKSSSTPTKGIVCTKELKPVCGNDGKTYSNACQAKISDISVKTEGECKVPEKLPTPPPTTETPKPVTVDVAIINFAFDAREVKIPPGSTIVWTNKDSSGHTATSDTGAFDSGFLGQGASFKRMFNEKGIFPYHCTPHPSMTATIIVK